MSWHDLGPCSKNKKTGSSSSSALLDVISFKILFFGPFDMVSLECPDFVHSCFVCLWFVCCLFVCFFVCLLLVCCCFSVALLFVVVLVWELCVLGLSVLIVRTPFCGVRGVFH